MMKTTFFVAFVSFLSAANAVAPYNCSGVVQYSLSFYGSWSNDTHGAAFPMNGSFSPIIGVSHESAYTLWGPDMKATPGVEYVAETGDTTVLADEIQTAISSNKTAWKTFMASGKINGTGHVMDLEVEVTKDFPLVSLITMIAPSPDWFTGVMDVSLCDTTSGTWLYNKTVEMLHPWDAGTENGTTFDTTNDATDPVQNIDIITPAMDTPFNIFNGSSIPTLGRVVIQRKNPPMMRNCEGEVSYTLDFEALWTSATHPNGFPSGPHFSPLVVATHSYKYRFWSDMTRASAGVKMVAETGNPATLYDEINNYIPNFVYKAYKQSEPLDSPGESSMTFSAKDEFSKVSVISMIAPSPDWFVGLDSYELCGDDGNWKTEGKMDLFPWDAGTENGTEFNTDNSPIMPYDVITRITSDSDTVIKQNANTAFAKITFTRQDAKPGNAPAQSQSVFSVLAFASLAILSLLY